MCKYATYCPEDNVVHPCWECIECLNSQGDIDIDREINEFNTMLDKLRDKFGSSNVKYINPYHGVHQEECEELPF